MNTLLLPALLILLTGWLAAAGRVTFALPLLVGELALLPLMALSVRRFRRALSVCLKPPALPGEAGQPFRVEAELSNAGWLPIPRLRVTLLCRDRFTGKDVALRGAALVEGRGRCALRFTLEQAYCGTLELTPVELELWDYLGLFPQRVPLSQPVTLFHLLPSGEGEGPSPGTGQGGGGEDTPGVGGKAALGEEYELRDFRQGDAVRQIHWKMSAKLDELISRDFRRDEGGLLLLALEPVPPERWSRALWEDYARTVSRVSYRLLSRGCPHTVVWAEEATGQSRVFPIGEPAARLEMLCALMELPTAQTLGLTHWKEERSAYEKKETVLRLGWSEEEGRMAVREEQPV